MKKAILNRLVMILLAAVLLASCQTSIRFAVRPESSGGNTGKSKANEKSLPASGEDIAIVAEAEKWVGTPYCFGGSSHDCTDCSGFVMNIYKNFGIELPRTAAEQFEYSSKIGAKERKPGDLVFFKTKSKISHVGIYAGNNQIIHASSGKGIVMRQSLEDPYLQKICAGYGRVKN